MASTKNIASQWFKATEAAGEFMGIRYGRVAQESDEAEWIFVHHCECDGIGGLARLLRERGAELLKLPQTKHSCRWIIGPLLKFWRDTREKRGYAERDDWKRPTTPVEGASRAVAWHLFTESETRDILGRCRRELITVNSLLLKHLDQAIRPEVRRPHLKIPWMVPVNLRGQIRHADDTSNHVSWIEIGIAPDDPVEAIQMKILMRLKRGEHRAVYVLLWLGRFLSHEAKVKGFKESISKPMGNIGTFSNLGVWDPERTIETDDSWLFCPPVVTGQLLGAGCVTFQNRLGLTIQSHPGLADPPDIATGWMKRWVEGISGSRG